MLTLSAACRTRQAGTITDRWDCTVFRRPAASNAQVNDERTGLVLLAGQVFRFHDSVAVAAPTWLGWSMPHLSRPTYRSGSAVDIIGS